MSDEPTTTPSTSISDPLALSFQKQLADPGDDERVGDAEQEREGDHGEEGRSQLAEHDVHQLTPRAEMMRSMSLIPMNGAMIPPRP